MLKSLLFLNDDPVLHSQENKINNEVPLWHMGKKNYIRYYTESTIEYGEENKISSLVHQNLCRGS